MASISIGRSPSSSSPVIVMRPFPPCHLRFRLSEVASPSSAAQLAPLPFVRRCSRTGWGGSGSLWGFCGTCTTHLGNSLLRSCLALPKLSYMLRTCPPSSIINAAAGFDAAIREALESILGGPLTEWSWINASLPCSRGGINLRSASLHAPAAFLASVSHSQALVESMLGQAVGPSPHSSSTVAVLSAAASRPDGQCLEDIDVPLHQHSLSVTIDEALHQHLLSTAPSTHARALTLSSALPQTGDWLNGIPSATLGLLQDLEFRFCHATGWKCPFTAPPTPALNATTQLTLLVTTRSAVGATGIG